MIQALYSAEAALADYEAHLQPARARFAAGAVARTLLATEPEPEVLAAFLLHFSVRGVPITKPVEDWILRAADRCEALDLDATGRALRRHAREEANHHEYHLNDLAALIDFWNTRWSPAISPAAISETTAGTEQYCGLHEDNIAGRHPYCQLAIEYEIERLSVEYGPRLVELCVRQLGIEILDCMSFITSHSQFDVGHTAFNAHELAKVMIENPERLEPLCAAGSAALDAYGNHLSECLQDAEQLAKTSTRIKTTTKHYRKKTSRSSTGVASGQLHWELHTPPGQTMPTWQEELSAFRGRVLFADHRRPEFQLADGRFADPDPIDALAHHVIARDNRQQIIGCIRLFALDETSESLTESLLGSQQLADMLQTLGVKRCEVIECGRWICDPRHRIPRLGMMLAASAGATARALGYATLLCCAGKGRDRALSRIGLQPVPGIPPVAVPKFDDTVRMMYIHSHQPSPLFAELMRTMATRLDLSVAPT